MQLDFQGLGWEVKLRKRRASHVITLAKELVRGNLLKQGDELHYYLVKAEGRRAILLFLDGQEMGPPKVAPKSNVIGLSV